MNMICTETKLRCSKYEFKLKYKFRVGVSWRNRLFCTVVYGVTLLQRVNVATVCAIPWWKRHAPTEVDTGTNAFEGLSSHYPFWLHLILHYSLAPSYFLPLMFYYIHINFYHFLFFYYIITAYHMSSFSMFHFPLLFFFFSPFLFFHVLHQSNFIFTRLHLYSIL